MIDETPGGLADRLGEAHRPAGRRRCQTAAVLCVDSSPSEVAPGPATQPALHPIEVFHHRGYFYSPMESNLHYAPCKIIQNV